MRRISWPSRWTTQTEALPSFQNLPKIPWSLLRKCLIFLDYFLIFWRYSGRLCFVVPKKWTFQRTKKCCWNVYHFGNCQGSGARPWGCNVLKPGAGSNQVPFPRPLVERCAARPSYPGRSKPSVGPLPFRFWPKPVQLLVSSFLDFLSYHKLQKRIYRVCLLWDGVTPEQ